MTPWYRFLTDLGDRGGETAKISNRRTALAIRAEHILIAKAETDAPLADLQGKSQSSSGNNGGKNSYYQSRNGLMVICMRVRLAIFLANICRNSNYFRYTWRPGIVFFFTDLGDCGWETAIISIRSAVLAIRADKNSYCHSRNRCAPSGFVGQISQQLWQ